MQHLKTILLTGASGFLGSHLLEALLKQHYKVVILKRSTSNTWRIQHLLDQVISYDVDTQPLEMAFEQQQIDVIIHTATLYRKFDHGKEISEMIQSNITFPTELLEVALRKKVKAFFNTGTFFEYDCSIQPINESAKLKPFNLYAKTKIAFETILSNSADTIAVNTFRLFSPYGEKDNHKLILSMIKKSISGELLELSEGLQKIDLIYVNDIVHAYLKAIERLEQQNIFAEYQVFNIGSGGALSIRDIVSILEELLAKPIQKKWGAKSVFEIPIAYADINKAQKFLGWSPQTDIKEGLHKMLNFYKERELK